MRWIAGVSDANNEVLTAALGGLDTDGRNAVVHYLLGGLAGLVAEDVWADLVARAEADARARA